MLSERKQYYLIHFSAPPEDKFLKVNQKLPTKPNQSRLKLRRGGDYVRESLFFFEERRGDWTESSSPCLGGEVYK